MTWLGRLRHLGVITQPVYCPGDRDVDWSGQLPSGERPDPVLRLTLGGVLVRRVRIGG
jgi:hypothetical protein